MKEINSQSVTCSCRGTDDFMEVEPDGSQHCAHCGLRIRLGADVLPAEWFIEGPESSEMYPSCLVCGESMLYGGGGWSQIEQEYFKDRSFFCAKAGNHVIGAYFERIDKSEYDQIVDLGTTAMTTIAVEGLLFEPEGGVADQAAIVSINQDGTRIVDLSALRDEEKERLIDACRHYTACGLLHDLRISERRISFLPDQRLVDALEIARRESIPKPKDLQ